MLEVAKALQSNNHNQALALVKKVNKTSRSYNSLTVEAGLWRAKQKTDKALALFKASLDFCENDQQRYLAHKDLGDCYIKTGELELGQEHLTRSLAINGGAANAEARMALGKLHIRRRHDFAQAEACFKPLLALNDYHIKASLLLLDYGFEFGLIEPVESYLTKLLNHLFELKENEQSVLLSRLSKLGADRLEPVLTRLLGQYGVTPVLTVWQAQLAFLQKNFDDVLTLLTDELMAQLPSWFVKSFVYELQAKCQDKVGQYPQAFAAYELMNKEMALKANPDLVKYDDYKALLKFANTQHLEVEPDSHRKICFFIGFPRSGTTLIENFLDSQSEVVTLDEQPALKTTARAFDRLGKVYPRDLHKLTKEDKTELRKIYFAEAAKSITLDEHDLLVDKLPIGTMHLPLILTLFPEAKILFSLRHPLDVCLSCYFQQFLDTAELRHFNKLETTFKRYRDIFDLYGLYKEKFDFACHYVKYEDLVADKVSELAKLGQFLDIDITSLEHSPVDDKKIVNSASTYQVKEGLYSSSVYRWKNYQEYIQPYRHLVEKFITEFDYQ